MTKPPQPERPPFIGCDLALARDAALLAEALPSCRVAPVSSPRDASGLDLLILDVRRLPDWKTALQSWRARPGSYVPVLALLPRRALRASDLDQLWPLVDDWQTLPLRPVELRARIHALLRIALHSRQQLGRMVELLQHSQRRYQQVAELLSDYCYALRLDGESGDEFELEWEGGDLRRLGLVPEAARLGWWSQLDAASLLECRQQFALAQAGQASRRELRLGPAGSGRWVQHDVAPLFEGERVAGVFAAVRDIDATHRQLLLLQFLRHALDGSPSAMVLWQAGQAQPLLFNPAAAALCEQPEVLQLLYRQLSTLVPGQSRRELLEVGRDRTLDLQLSRIAAEEDDLLLAAGRDVSEELRQAQALQHAESHDRLTGLPGRTLFTDLLAHALGQNQPYALVLFDFANLRTINESLGHEAGDAALLAVLTRLRSRFSGPELLARMDGNEFALLLPQRPDEADETIGARLELLRQSLELPLPLDGETLLLHASFGVALAPRDGTQAAVLLQHAESALSEARQAGGRRVCFFRPELNAAARRRLTLEAELREAFARGEFCLHYQLQWPSRAGLPFGTEALLRWQHPSRGLLGPGAFIDVLEDMELIHAVGLWVVESACQQWRHWQQAGLGDIVVAVNVAARQLQEPGFAQAVRAIVAEQAISPDAIELELTESQVMRDLDLARRLLGELHAAGLTLALDDFGTGHASLAYLAELPFQRLKVDQRFVRGLPEGGKTPELVRAILLMAQALGLKTVAEGVEDERQAEWLRRQGVHWLQGFHLARPCPPEDIPHLVRRGQAWLARHT